MNTKNPRDLYGDGHGFVDVPQVGRKVVALPVTGRYTPGIFRVEVFDFEGKPLRAHHCNGSYDLRGIALRAVITACNDATVGHVEFTNQCKPREYSYDYDLTQAPKDDTRILGLYKLRAPGTEQGWSYHSRVIWLAKEPTESLRYLTDERSDAPYYIDDPIAWARTPQP